MSNKNLKYLPFVIIASLILIYISRSISNQILLFPFWVKAILFFIALPVATYFVKKWAIFSSNKGENKKMVLAINGLLAVLVAFVILALIKLPINMVIKQQSRKNELITQTCPITFYSLGLKNQQKKHITFTFQNKPIRMKVKPTVMAKIKALQTPQKFIQLQVRKSILGTYVVEDYEVN